MLQSLAVEQGCQTVESKTNKRPQHRAMQAVFVHIEAPTGQLLTILNPL